MPFADMMPLNSLSLKVLLAFVAGVLLSIALVIAATVWTRQSDALARMDLADATQDVATKVRFDSGGMPVSVDADANAKGGLAWAFDSLRREAAYRVLDDAGNAVLLSPAGQALWPVPLEPRELTRGLWEFKRDGVTMYGTTEPLSHGGRTWYFQMAVSKRFMTLLHRVALPLVVQGVTAFCLILLAAFGLCAYVTLRYTFKPLRDVSDSAAAISPRSLHARLNTEAVPAEIAPLVNNFNQVLERLETGYRLQQEFLARAAHELKTPLALIRAQIEVADNGRADHTALLGDVEYMTRQVQQLLHLTEASEVHNYRFSPVVVQEVVHETVEYLRRMASAAGVRLTISCIEEGARWQADRGALFTLLKNLLENALQHAPRGSDVNVEVLDGEITVRDRGPGVETAQLPHLFDRFWRGAHRRDQGAGLGLAICREVALAHGWHLCAERAEPGLRLRVLNHGNSPT